MLIECVQLFEFLYGMDSAILTEFLRNGIRISSHLRMNYQTIDMTIIDPTDRHSAFGVPLVLVIPISRINKAGCPLNPDLLAAIFPYLQ